MKQVALLTALLLALGAPLQGQIATSFKMGSSELSPLLGSNTVSDILVQGDTVWIGSGRGPSFSSDAGKSWRNLANSLTFDDKSVSAIAVGGDQVWVATAYTTTFDNVAYQTGHGLHYSLDGGATWTFIPQPVDTGKVDTLMYGRNKIPALAITVPQQNLTFDIAFANNFVWIASRGGMLRKSSDLGKTWQRVILPPDNLDEISPDDSLNFDLSNVEKTFASDPLYYKDTLSGNFNHRVFAVYASDDSTIWVGTADGINKSTDGGISWRKFNHQNQLKPISGNFIVAINEQRWGEKRIIWAAAGIPVHPDEKLGVSFSDDGGATWRTALLGDFAHNIAFKDSIVYVAADGGLYRSSDNGNSWLRTGTIYDPATHQRFTTTVVYAVATQGDTVWVGGPDGLAYTIDSASESFGSTWHIFRTYETVANSAKTYSYPLPFSPANEVVRLHYGTGGETVHVTVRIFDFGMQPVKTLIRNATRSGSQEHDEIWDGRNDLGRRVANGVYFYQVEVAGKEPMWGRILVLQ